MFEMGFRQLPETAANLHPPVYHALQELINIIPSSNFGGHAANIIVVKQPSLVRKVDPLQLEWATGHSAQLNTSDADISEYWKVFEPLGSEAPVTSVEGASISKYKIWLEVCGREQWFRYRTKLFFYPSA